MFSDGDKALVMKQFLSDEKVEEISEIIEMKITHRKGAALVSTTKMLIKSPIIGQLITADLKRHKHFNSHWPILDCFWSEHRTTQGQIWF